jgi:FAD/FMN-containing dehydrogenase
MREEAYRNLSAKLRGSVITPGSDEYEVARRVYNGMIDRRPEAIVRCADVADVAAAVNFAHNEDVAVAVRGGGHNGAGLGVCDRGVVIDLSSMKGVLAATYRDNYDRLVEIKRKYDPNNFRRINQNITPD